MKENSRTRSMVDPKSTRSLHGKSIYLDLFGYRNVAEFEKNLQLLGAVVEKCFSKDVSHVITNRASTINSSQTRSASKNQTVEAAIASPLSLSPFADSGGNQSPFAFSPILTDSVSRPMTRGQAIVQKAMLSRKCGSTNVIDCAQQWNIKVVHINAAVKWVKKELGTLEAQQQEKKLKVMQLTRPYIKFEESCRRFCPEFKILAGFPSLDFNGPCTTCPFDQFAKPCSVENAGNQSDSSPCPKASTDLASKAERCQVKPNAELPAKLKWRKPDKEKRKFTNATTISSSKHGRLMTAGELLQKLKNCRIDAARQKGFCEICDIKYDNMLQHLRTKKHKSFVEDEDNYQSLDKLIRRIPDETTVQMIDPTNEFPKVTAPSSTGSSESDEYDLNLLSVPSSTLSSHFKTKVPPEWNNSCSAFCWSGRSNGEGQAASNTVLLNTTDLLLKPLADTVNTEPYEPKINYHAVEETCNYSLGKHLEFNEQKSSYGITNVASFNQNTVNSEKNVESLGNLGDHGSENPNTSKINNSLRPDDIIPGILESEASCKLNVGSVTSHVLFMHQSDDCELDSDEVSSEIPVIQSMHLSKETCKMNSEGIHLSSMPPIAQPITFAPEGSSMNCDAAFEFLQLPCHTDQLRLQSQISCHATVTDSPYECCKHCYSPSKCCRHSILDMAGSPLKCQKLPLPEVIHFHQASLGSFENCVLDGCKSRKSKRIKFSRAVSVLTNRSVLELFESDTSSNFEGFTEVPEQVVTDLSFHEVSEAVLSIDSDFDWACTSSDSRLESLLVDAETRTYAVPENPVSSIAPIISSISKDCSLSEANLKMVCDSKAPTTHSISNKNNENVLTIMDLSNHESDTDDYLPSLNFKGNFDCLGKDTPASLADNYDSPCTSQQEDILTYIDKDASDILVKPISSNGNCYSLSFVKDISGLNQRSVDSKDCLFTAVNGKISQVPANVKLPLTSTNAKNTVSRSWQPVVALRKCDDWERGCDGDKEHQMSVSNSRSAVQDELSSEVYSLVEAANGFHRLRRKLNFSHVTDEDQPCGLEKKKSLRRTAKCSGMMYSLPSENMSTSRCKVEMPKVTNVLDLVDLESNGEINVEEVLLTDTPSYEQILCCESSTVDVWDQNSVGSHFSYTTVTHKTHSTISKGELAKEIFYDCSTASGVITAGKSDNTIGQDVINVGESSMQTDDLAHISSEVGNTIVACNLKARELMSTDQDFDEKAAECNVMDRTLLKSCFHKIRNNKIWQPVVVLDRSSVKPNIPCPCQPNVSISSRSNDEHVAKWSSIQNGMISIEPLNSYHSAFVLADAQGSEMPFTCNEDVLSGKQKISRGLVVLLNRCDSQLTGLCHDVLNQKMPVSTAGLFEKKNLVDIKSHSGCIVNGISLINNSKDVNVAADLKGSNNTCQLCEHEVKDVGRPTLGCGHGASEKLAVRICRSKTFENSNHMHSSIGVNTKKKLTNTDVNLRKTSITGAVSGYAAEEPLEALGTFSLTNSVRMRNSDVQSVSSDNRVMNKQSSEMLTGQKVRKNIYSPLNRSLSRKYLDWSKPETYENSINSKPLWTIKTRPNKCLDLLKKNECRRSPRKNNNFNHFLPRSKADWSKSSPPG